VRIGPELRTGKGCGGEGFTEAISGVKGDGVIEAEKVEPKAFGVKRGFDLVLVLIAAKGLSDFASVEETRLGNVGTELVAAGFGAWFAVPLDEDPKVKVLGIERKEGGLMDPNIPLSSVLDGCALLLIPF
jgi:hypothetical protein